MPMPILCLDFDGVCHSYLSGWQGAAVIPDPPVPGLFEALEDYVKRFEVHIYSSRTSQAGGLAAMQQWLCHHWMAWVGQLVTSPATPPTHMFLHLIHFPTEKPPAMVGLDDRVLTFRGCWPTVEALVKFRPWHIEPPIHGSDDNFISNSNEEAHEVIETGVD